MAWAFVKADHLDALLFTALVRATERKLGDFNMHSLVNTAWAFCKKYLYTQCMLYNYDNLKMFFFYDLERI